eukprot:3004392-Rhodomonas_salina.1
MVGSGITPPSIVDLALGLSFNNKSTGGLTAQYMSGYIAGQADSHPVTLGMTQTTEPSGHSWMCFRLSRLSVWPWLTDLEH